MVTQENIAQAVDILVLGTFGIPGTPLARRAAQGVEALRRDRQARSRLEADLRQAEEEFRKEARKQGLETVAQWVAMLPQQNRSLFRQALEALLERWDETELQHLLEQEFAGIAEIDSHAENDSQQKQKATALYLQCLRSALLADNDFRPVILALSILRTETRVEQLQEHLKKLYDTITALRGLSKDLITWPGIPPLQQSELPRAFLAQPKYRLVPYSGRGFQQTLDELLAWAKGLEQAKGQVGLRLYLAPGGSGKTRLLIEAGQALRQEGWWVGFLHDHGSLDLQTAKCLVSDPRPTLLILDYVAQRQAAAMTLLQALIPIALAHLASEEGLSPRAAPFALIFLERTMPEWLAETLESGEGLDHPHRWEFLALPGVERGARSLPSIELEERSAFFQRTVEAFRQHLKASEAPTSPVTYAPQDLPERPLPLILLALHAAAGHRLASPRDETAILEFTWQREREAWKRLLRPSLEKHGVTWAEGKALEGIIEQVLLLATLGRSFAEEAQLAAFLQAHFPPIRSATGQALDWDWLAGRFRELFPEWKVGPLPPVTPDPLADFALAQGLERWPELLDRALPTRQEMEGEATTAAGMIWKTFGVLERLWSGGWQEEGWECLKRASTCVEKRLQGEEHRLLPFLEEMDRRLLVAEEVAGEKGSLRLEPVRRMTVWPLAAAIWSALLKAIPPKEIRERARLSGNLGMMLSALGRREEALAATEEAAALYRGLAQQNPQAFLPYLAASLNNLGNRLSDLGRREEALAATEEALALYRELAQANPQAFLPDLASSLHNLGAMLSDLGRREEALAATEEAVAIRRQLAQANPQAFLPYLAMSLNNLGMMLSKLGRREEALAAAEEALALYRGLAQQNPQAFLPELAASLGAHGSVLLGLGRPAEAAASFAEGIRLLLPFARTLPQAFARLLRVSVEYYQRACQAAGQPPEEALLHEVTKILGDTVGQVHPAVAQLAPLLLAVVAVVRGEAGEDVKTQVQAALKMLQTQDAWQALGTALERLLNGERAPQAWPPGWSWMQRLSRCWNSHWQRWRRRKACKRWRHWRGKRYHGANPVAQD